MYFEDGSYSRGPLSIGEDPGRVMVIEHCIGRAGHNRIRVSHTITAESHPWCATPIPPVAWGVARAARECRHSDGGARAGARPPVGPRGTSWRVAR